MRRLAALTAACVVGLCAQTAQERGRKIVMDSLAALGGERFRAVVDRVESGRAYSFYREQVSGLAQAVIYTRYLPADVAAREGIAVRERQSFIQDKKEREISAILFTGGAGYEITFRGARPLPAETVERFKVSTLRNILYILKVRLNEPGMIFEHRGMEVYINQPVDVVDVVDAQNEVVTVYFHQSTKFPVRQVFYRRDPQTRARIEEVTEYGRFRDVGEGVFWPHTILRFRDGIKIYEMYSESVQINQKLSDSLFILPTGIKILKPL